MVTFSAIVTMVATVILAVANVCLVLVTGLYVCLTRKLVKVQTDPLVIICDVKQEDQVSIKIENIGKGTAYDVRFEPSNGVQKDVWEAFLNHTLSTGLIRKTEIGQGMPVLFPGSTRQHRWQNDDTELTMKLCEGLPVVCRFNRRPKGNSQEKSDIVVQCFLDLISS